MKVVKKLKTEAKPDGSAYATPFHKLYVSDERGRAEAVVDVQKDEIIHTLHIKTYRLALLLKNETSVQAQRTHGLDCTILNAEAHLLTPERINAPYRAVSHVRVCVVEQV